MPLLRRSRLATMLGLGRAPSSRTTSRPKRSPSRASARRTRKATYGEGGKEMSEATLPGLETVEPVLPVTDRARAAEAADALLRPLEPRARGADRRQARRRPRRGQAEDLRQRRDVRPLRRLDPRGGRVHRPVGKPARQRPPRRAADHGAGGEARL